MKVLTCEYRLEKVVTSLGVMGFVTCDLNGNVCDVNIKSVLSLVHREVEDVEVFVFVFRIVTVYVLVEFSNEALFVVLVWVPPLFS